MEPFQVLPPEPEDVTLGRPGSAHRGQAEGHIWTERSFDAQILARRLQARNVSGEDDEVRMSLQRGAGPPEILGRREVDRLGELKDWILRERGHELFAELLPRRPEIAEVPAPVYQDRAAADASLKGSSPERDAVSGVRDFNPEVVEYGPLSDPDRTVADVRVVREIYKRTGPIGWNHGPRVLSIAPRRSARLFSNPVTSW